MGLHVVEAACRFSQDRAQATIFIESDITHDFPAAIEGLSSTEARNLALGYAAQSGVPDPRLNGNVPHPFPINSEGLSLEQVRDEVGNSLPPQHPRMQIARFRVEVPVCRKLI